MSEYERLTTDEYIDKPVANKVANKVAEKVFNLVFCQDCHYATHDADKPTLWRCHNSNWYKTDDDFCSKGEKK